MKPALLLQTLNAIVPEIGTRAVDALAPGFTATELARGASLLSQGERWRWALLIERGLVRMHFVRRDGREFNKNFFAEGALICPITPAMWTAPSLFGITCIEATRVWRCEEAQFRAVLQAHGAWQALQRELLERLLSCKRQREHGLLALDACVDALWREDRRSLLVGAVLLCLAIQYYEINVAVIAALVPILLLRWRELGGRRAWRPLLARTALLLGPAAVVPLASIGKFVRGRKPPHRTVQAAVPACSTPSRRNCGDRHCGGDGQGDRGKLAGWPFQVPVRL